MGSNSIIESQLTLKEEQEKEIERCKDPHYFYLNYTIINGKIPTFWQADRDFFNWWQKIIDNPDIKGVIDLKLNRRPIPPLNIFDVQIDRSRIKKYDYKKARNNK